jgi:hypothetical protein
LFQEAQAEKGKLPAGTITIHVLHLSRVNVNVGFKFRVTRRLTKLISYRNKLIGCQRHSFIREVGVKFGMLAWVMAVAASWKAKMCGIRYIVMKYI